MLMMLKGLVLGHSCVTSSSMLKAQATATLLPVVHRLFRPYSLEACKIFPPNPLPNNQQRVLPSLYTPLKKTKTKTKTSLPAGQLRSFGNIWKSKQQQQQQQQQPLRVTIADVSVELSQSGPKSPHYVPLLGESSQWMLHTQETLHVG